MTKRFKHIWVWVRNLIAVFFVSTLMVVVIYRFIPVFATPLMAIRLVEDGAGIKHRWVSIDHISRSMIHAVIASEDNRFMQHGGFDTEQIKLAIEESQRGKRVRGASTISQQTAKNVFLWPGKNFIRKGLEAYFTLLIEWIWGKERIMEVYLNSIEMGKGIYGVEAAAQHYFGKTADRLTNAEAALIAASLPNPRKRNPAKPSAYMKRRQGDIVALMGKINHVDFGYRYSGRKSNNRK